MNDIIRIARPTCLLLALLLVATPSMSPAQRIYYAPLRTPQVVVHGTGLRDYFTSVGEPITPSTDQRDGSLLTSSVSNNATTTFEADLASNPDGLVTGIYNGYDANPALMPVFPAVASAGWFAIISFRTAPVRVVVNRFDANASLVGTATYLGADKRGIGWYVQGAGGTFYSQDARNAGGAPQLLFFAGTGYNTGSAWLSVEDQPVAGGADGDYDDLILFFEEFYGVVTPLRHSTWGELKSRFR